MTPTPPRIRASQHALDALAIFYPWATGDDLIREVESGVPIERDTALGLVGRRGSRCDDGSTYVLHRERTGLFVVERAGNVITFLRFYGWSQYETAARLWPGGDAPTCVAGWVGGDDQARLEAETTPAAKPSRPPKRLRPWDPTAVPKVTAGARNAAGVPTETIQVEAMEAVRGGLEVPGVLVVNGARLSVVHVGSKLRVILSTEEGHARDIARAAAAKTRLEEERLQAGLRQAAEHLRAHGWTCTPPEGQ